MTSQPSFFLPSAPIELAESEYSAIAGRSNVQVPPASERIYSLNFTHDSNHWIATVGETLRGSKRHASGKGRKMVEHFTETDDAAKVLAIYDQGAVYFVVNDGGAGRRSIWANPFAVGKPAGVTYFDGAPTSA